MNIQTNTGSLTLVKENSFLEQILIQIQNAQKLLLEFFMKKTIEDKRRISAAELSEMMAEMDKNTQTINSLLKTKYDAVSRIQMALELKSKSRTPLSAQQMDDYREFSRVYPDYSAILNETLDCIDGDIMKNRAQRAILSGESYIAVYRELKSVSDNQCSAITLLYQILDKCCYTLMSLIA